MSGISITCFAASYSVALALELSRLVFRSGIRGAIMLGFGAAGLLAHTIYLYERAKSVSGSPLSSEQDWYVVAAWFLAATYLYLTAYHRDNAGVFLLPLVLGLVAAGWLTRAVRARPAILVWGWSTGFPAAGRWCSWGSPVDVFAQDRRLKKKLPPLRSDCRAWNGCNGPTAGPSAWRC